MSLADELLADLDEYGGDEEADGEEDGDKKEADNDEIDEVTEDDQAMQVDASKCSRFFLSTKVETYDTNFFCSEL
jgi:hypothetical protein